ncbi:MAG: hypothetical protein IPH33_05605 [Bacteroidetes bacterium]|nr:hypothetical protein [Bacteroidota bacterium]
MIENVPNDVLILIEFAQDAEKNFLPTIKAENSAMIYVTILTTIQKLETIKITDLQQQEFCVVAIRTLIGESTTATVPIEALDSIGFPFDLYSNRDKSSPISETYYVWYGPYRLNLTSENQIQITLKNA